MPCENPGCGKKLKLQHMGQHAFNCEDAVTVCPHPGCGLTLKRRHMKDHEVGTF